ncbi:hypothetical protein DSM104299_00220 [Baekduia alba]|nr:hypothetical protein DSM104299_00220 [Baekduia alba]
MAEEPEPVEPAEDTSTAEADALPTQSDMDLPLQGPQFQR